MKMLKNLSPELLYLAIGSASAFVTSILRSAKKSFWAKIAEGITCSMISSALIVVSEYYLKLPLELSAAIGTFVGFLGSDYISTKIKSIINIKIKDNDNENK